MREQNIDARLIRASELIQQADGLIIAAGVSRFVRHKAPFHARRSDWAASIAMGDLMLREAGVEVVTVEEKLGVRIRFDGEEAEA